MLLRAQSNDDEILSKQKEAERILAEARAAAQKQIQDAKSSAQEQQTKRLAEVKAVRGCWPFFALTLHAWHAVLLLWAFTSTSKPLCTL